MLCIGQFYDEFSLYYAMNVIFGFYLMDDVFTDVNVTIHVNRMDIS